MERMEGIRKRIREKGVWRDGKNRRKGDREEKRKI